MREERSGYQKSVYYMTDRELRAYKWRQRRQRELRRKVMTFVATLCLIFTCMISYHAITTSANTGEDELNFKYYTNITVQNGETLWDIADKYIDYDQYDGKREYVAEVVHINHLDEDASLRAGQHIVVPYYSTEFVK
ncbi:MAG: LysM peptidoglycan-binding domain-containing protein [Acetatifactor sp.]|nr:LysM peptidoglycan-binding domain-containing protein [Acetatifactor sp.]